MSNVLKSIYDSVISKLNLLDVNQATLSGAIDIVVVHHPPGSRPRKQHSQQDVPDDEEFYASTPFHVRFGKLHVLKSAGLPVRIIVNGEDTQIMMKLGRAGEAFFVTTPSESEERMREQFTSPIHTPNDTVDLQGPPPMQLSPIQDVREDGQAEGGGAHMYDSDVEHPDLDPKQVAEMNFMWWSWGWGNVPMPNSAAMGSNFENSGGSGVPEMGGVDGYHVDESGQVTLKTMRRVPSMVSLADMNEQEVQAFQAEILREPSMRNKLKGELDDMEDSSRWSWLWGIMNLFKNKKPDAANDATASVKDYITAEEQEELEKERERLHRAKRLQNSDERSKSPSKGPRSSSRLSGTVTAERVQSPSLTEEALQTHLQENEENDGEQLTDNGEGSLITQASEGSALDMARDNSIDFHKWRQLELANAILPSPSMVSNVQMSLCGHLLGPDTLDNKKHFEQNIVTFHSLNSTPDIVFNPRLIILSNRKLYPARVALPLMISFLAFQRPLTDDALLGLATQDSHYGHLHTRTVRSDDEEESPMATPEAESDEKKPALPQPDSVSPSKTLSATGDLSRTISANATTPPLSPHEDSENNTRSPPNGRSLLDMPALEVPPDTPPTQRIPRRKKKQMESGDTPTSVDTTNAEFEWSQAWNTTKTPERKRKGRHKRSRSETDPALKPRESDSPSPPPITLSLPSLPKRTDEKTWEDGDEKAPPDHVILDLKPMTPKSKKFVKTLRPTSEMLKKLNLKPGRNKIEFVVQTSLQGRQSITAGIYLWPSDSKIIISDVDGTITKSDAMGWIMPWVGMDWSHRNVAQFFDKMERGGYNLMYLTSRAIGQADMTRTYLFRELKQYTNTDQLYVLPQGPVIMAPDSLLRAARRELILRRPQDFKIPALTDIRNLFSVEHNPFYAGFGNRVTDLISYHAVGVPKHRVFIINPSGEISNSNNIEYSTTYTALLECSDQMFPPRVDGKPDIEEAYTSFNYWKQPTYVDATDLMDLEDPATSEEDPWAALEKSTPAPE